MYLKYQIYTCHRGSEKSYVPVDKLHVKLSIYWLEWDPWRKVVARRRHSSLLGGLFRIVKKEEEEEGLRTSGLDLEFPIASFNKLSLKINTGHFIIFKKKNYWLEILNTIEVEMFRLIASSCPMELLLKSY